MRRTIHAGKADGEGEFLLHIHEDDGLDYVPEHSWREMAEILGRRLPPPALRALYERFSRERQLEHAARIVKEKGCGKVCDLQHAFHLGWTAALDLMEALEANGVVVRDESVRDRPEFKVVGAGEGG